jgi:DnaJ-class molecular chaperone
MAKTRSFSDVFNRYKTYNPQERGYGSVSEWGKSFNETMGVEEAAEALGEDNPLSILGLTGMPTVAELKKVYRKLMLIYHPDVTGTGDAEHAKKVIAAYTTLMGRIERQNR